MISSTLFGQSNFYPIGAKWVYEIPCAERSLVTLISEKDTIINGLSLRKIRYLNTNNEYHLFQIDTNGVYRYLDGKTYLYYPLKVKLNDIVDIELPFQKVSNSATHTKFKGTCIGINFDTVSSTIVKNFNIKIVDSSYYDYKIGETVHKGWYVQDWTLVYNNMTGLSDWVGDDCYWTPFIPTPFRVGLVEGYSKLTFTFNKIQNKNAKWSMVDAVSDEINTIGFKIYPNPTQNSISIEGNATNYQIKSLQGSLLGVGEIPSNGKIDVNQFDNGMYLLSLYNGNQFLTTQKIIIQK
jgi:hypothetical protein